MFSLTENACIDEEGSLWLFWSWAALFFSVSLLAGYLPKCSDSLPVIYGNDDRREPQDYKPFSMINRWTRSVAIVVDQNSLEPIDDSSFKMGFETLAESMRMSGKPLCESESFAAQPVFDGICSAFLVAPNKMVTAGHCVNSENCSFVGFVFGVGYAGENKDISQVMRTDTYFCKRIIKRVRQPKGLDFALIELDRPVIGRTPLAMRRHGTIYPYEELILIGNPVGLPTKVARYGRILDNSNPVSFKGSTDSYGGQSGSPVIGARSNMVEGILISGEKDFEKIQIGCWVSKRCSEDGPRCTGETILRSTEFSQYLD